MTDLSVNPIDEPALAAKRLRHLRAQMIEAGLDVCVLTNPVSIRYATGYRGYATFQAHIPSQYLLIPAEGPVVLHGAYTDHLSTIDRCETAHSVTAFDAGLTTGDAALRFTHDIERSLHEAGLPATSIVGIERLTPMGFKVLHGSRMRIADAEGVVELARSRKLPEEYDAIRYAVAVAELGIERMRDALAPGITENQLFAILHHTNIAHDGDWIDGRMLCSGPRTNPWYQEASARRIEQGDLVAFDTDMIGPNGYCADISRTWVCGDAPTPAQRDLYKRAQEEIEHNTEQLAVGASFRELSDRSYRQPDEFVANRYACVFHGVGMSDEFPKIPYPNDWNWTGYDGELEAGTVLSVESYVGAEGGNEGVKLEQMVRVTTEGVVPISTSPLWDRDS
ncbi:MAG: M24 family metallopeptidase [Acidimicrobiales bacterium]